MTSKVTIYCDGSCSGNPGPGGWGAILIWNGHTKTISGWEVATTNNRMELTAAIKALESIKGTPQIEIYTDSQYVCKGITIWSINWKAKGWKKDGKYIKNIDLWQSLDLLQAKLQAEWFWVEGHCGNELNEKADLLATEATKEAVSYIKNNK